MAVMRKELKTLRGFRTSLVVKLGAANKVLASRPSNYEAQLKRVTVLHALDLLDSYTQKGEEL